jgi:hypothetical protein
MAKYTAPIAKATTSTSIGVGSLEAPGSSQRRIKLLEFLCGSDAATLGTSNFRWEFNRSTTTATAGTTPTISQLDPADAACVSVVKGNLSANGTLTSGAIMMTIAMSEQATFRWVANPGSEIVIPASANNGIHFMTPVCGNTPSAAAQVTFEE